MPTTVADPSINLPPRKATPLSRDEPPLRRLLKHHGESIGDDDVYYTIKSKTKVDVGSWICKRRLCVIAQPSHLLLLANGKRPVAERFAYAQLQDSRYNHVTGALVLAPSVDPNLNSLRMLPVDGYQFLAQIFQQG